MTRSRAQASAHQFSTVLQRLRNNPGKIAYRKSWHGDDWIYIGLGYNKRPVLYRHHGIHSDPYSVQQDDLFANDWEVEDG